MQNWVKYILQATLASGGLLMLGTGIASAAENVDPDLPASLLDQHTTAPVTSGLAEALRQLDTAKQDSVLPAVDTMVTDVPAAVPPTSTPVGPVYPVPADLLDLLPPKVGDVAEALPEPDLYQPLGAELGATQLPILPVFPRVEQVENTLAGHEPAIPVQSELAVPLVPLSGTVASDPLNAGSGTRVTALHAEAPQVANSNEAPGLTPMPAMADVPGHPQRTDRSASELPLVGGLLSGGGSTLPTHMATSGSLPLLGALSENDLTHQVTGTAESLLRK
ncbi:hypothetical protein ACFQ05_14360 [Amycolatopsis umgeniensis]|uniref:Secreted protein n=1 Tax=Amycolatopsis umgeniensis TaxID=336628 RepID=A0A841B7F7_9PSEU|nr:hypothetical protein [Amycolatopsis umgeniensis]MBB5854488.1 hypothetical protein [Amycolatopsis umgeniensis]